MKKNKMKSELTKILKDTGIEFNKDEIKNLSSAYDKLVQAKNTFTKKTEKKKFNKLVKLFTELEDEYENTLFPNEIPDNHFGVPAKITDNMSTAIDIINEQFQTIESRYKRASKKNEFDIVVDTKEKIGFKFNDQIIADEEVENAEDIFDIIKQNIQDATLLQHYCALWNYAIKQGSFIYRYVPIDDVLETFLKKPKNGYFRQTTRKNFTTSIRKLEKMYVRVPVKSGKGKNQSGFINIPLLNFQISVENKAGDVLLNLVGELFGNKAGQFRGRIFPQGLFNLDARREGNRITLAFRLLTRFDQLNNQPIKWNRKKLIKQAGLQETDRHNKSEASNKLTKTLQKLQEIQCISGFSPQNISTKDNEEITLTSAHQKIIDINLQ